MYLPYRITLEPNTILVGILLLCLLSCRTVPSGQTTEPDDGLPSDSVDAVTRPTPNDEWEQEKLSCYQCHQTVFESYASSKHSTMYINCVICHGPSEKHVLNQAALPDITFMQAEDQDIEFCRIYCHTELPPDPHKEVKDCSGCHPAHTFSVP